jgi:mutual gliding-motility protein MglA
MFINWATGEINLKLVYYGPGMSGKTTNLEFVHSKLDPRLCGELISLKTKEDRTLFFDFLQLEIDKIKGKKPKFNLYTVPGQVFYATSRKVILNGVDGVVIVFDSQVDRLEDNLESLEDFKNNLIAYGYDFYNFPWVIQYNKRDLPAVESIENLEKALNPTHVPYFEAVAVEGIGVFDTLKFTINLVVEHIRHQLG